FVPPVDSRPVGRRTRLEVPATKQVIDVELEAALKAHPARSHCRASLELGLSTELSAANGHYCPETPLRAPRAPATGMQPRVRAGFRPERHNRPGPGLGLSTVRAMARLRQLGMLIEPTNDLLSVGRLLGAAGGCASCSLTRRVLAGSIECGRAGRRVAYGPVLPLSSSANTSICTVQSLPRMARASI